jgi:hypothetical protein
MASTYLTKTLSTPTNNKIFTLSMWVKRTAIGATHDLFTSGADNDNEFLVRLDNDDTLLVKQDQGASEEMSRRTNAKFKDVNCWYHLVIAIDTTQSTASDRQKIYINGVQETSFSSTVNFSQNADVEANKAASHTIGKRNFSSAGYFDGCISHIHFIDGTAYDASAFGLTDSTTGEWKINTSPSVTYGNNGFFILKDGNSVTDQSGNSNNWTVSGTLTKTEDNPSNVFATWNPLYYAGGSVTHSAGNTRFAESGNYWKSTLATIGASTGKYYAEFKCNGNWMIAGVVDLNETLEYGIVDRNFFSTTYISNQGYGIYNADGSLRYRGSETTYASTYGSGDILQVALDCDNNRVFFGINGTWQNSADPTSSGTGFAMNATNPIYTFACSVQTDEVHANFGNGYFNTTAVASAGTNASGIGIFEYNVPTGYTALSTKGLNE